MADITKCGNGERCKKKYKCKRFVSGSGMRQAYIDFYKKGEECEYFWDIIKDYKKVGKNV